MSVRDFYPNSRSSQTRPGRRTTSFSPHSDAMLLPCYLFVVLLYLARLSRGYEGFYYRDASGVNRYGLQGLSMDILEKIKQATGYPLNTDIFQPGILSARAKDRGAIKYFPFLSTKSLGKRRRKGSGYGDLGGEESSRGGTKHFMESGKSGKRGDSYDESSGSKDEFMNEAEFTDEHFHREEADEGEEYKGGRKRERAYLSKGYEDVYRKDETKKADSFWDDERTEGKWYKYGSKHRNRDKMEKDAVEEKKVEEGKEGDDYRDTKRWQSERESKSRRKTEHEDEKEHAEEAVEYAET